MGVESGACVDLTWRAGLKWTSCRSSLVTWKVWSGGGVGRCRWYQYVIAPVAARGMTRYWREQRPGALREER
jgi:hypothetical protein